MTMHGERYEFSHFLGSPSEVGTHSNTTLALLSSDIHPSDTIRRRGFSLAESEYRGNHPAVFVQRNLLQFASSVVSSPDDEAPTAVAPHTSKSQSEPVFPFACNNGETAAPGSLTTDIPGKDLTPPKISGAAA